MYRIVANLNMMPPQTRTKTQKKNTHLYFMLLKGLKRDTQLCFALPPTNLFRSIRSHTEDGHRPSAKYVSLPSFTSLREIVAHSIVLLGLQLKQTRNPIREEEAVAVFFFVF